MGCVPMQKKCLSKKREIPVRNKKDKNRHIVFLEFITMKLIFLKPFADSNQYLLFDQRLQPCSPIQCNTKSRIVIWYRFDVLSCFYYFILLVSSSSSAISFGNRILFSMCRCMCSSFSNPLKFSINVLNSGGALGGIE